MSENAQSANTFKFFHNAETRLYIEGVKEKENSIFSDVYRAFFIELKDKLADIRREESDKKDVELRNNLNNIFAFVGDRGSGKTSCMFSVAKMMEENGNNDQCKIPELKGYKINFSVLESIDPSFFDDRTNILDIVLGRLFSAFKEKWDLGNCDCTSKKSELLESFEKVKQSISNMNVKRYVNGNYICEEDNVEKLINLGASVNLKKDIQELIQRYLSFSDKNVLVIPIDDVDLHSKCAYEMVEQIRKYLVQYNVIILMALKIEQLDKVVEKAYVEEFDNLIKQNMLSQDQIADMANKYLIKLIPDSQRFVLPTIEIMYNRIVEIYEKTEQFTKNSLDFLGQKWEKDRINSDYPARYIVLKLIFDKTRYLFYNMQGATSLIVPHTLREYNHLLEMLLSIKNYKEANSDGEKQYNKNVFKNYFIQSWCRSNLKEGDYGFIKELFSIADPSIINKTVVQKINERFSDSINKKTEEVNRYNSSRIREINEIREVNRIIDEKNKSYNVSIGDVNLLLRLIKGTLIKFTDKAFVFAIETFYSMRLYEYYDIKTEMRRDVKKIEKEVVVKSALDGLEEYEILVGGSFFNIKNVKNRVIPISDNDQKRRDYRIISLYKIRKLLNPILEKNNEQLEKKEVSLIRLIEFFALFTLRRSYRTEDGIQSSDYRIVEDVVYTTEFSSNQDKIFFDIMAVFSNLPIIEKCYKRIDERLLKKANGLDNSLYKCLLRYCKEKRSYALDEKCALLSYGSIRNMEILNDFFNYMNDRMKKGKFSADNRESLIEFFRNIYGYSIKSYDEKNKEKEVEDKDWHQIDFQFVSEFIDVLKDVEIKESFDTIFSNETDEIQNNEMKPIKSSSLFKMQPIAAENIERNAIKKIETSRLFEDIYKCFDKGRMYSYPEVRGTIRSVLRNKIDQAAYSKLSHWITTNVKEYHQLWSNPEIENLIEKFVHYIHSLKEKMK